MKKIVLIIDDLNVGGAQTHVLRLVSALKIKDMTLEIVCLGSSGKIAHKINKLNSKVKISSVEMDSVWKFNFWAGFFKLISLLKKEKPLAVFTYLNTANVFGVIASKISSVPIIVSSRRDMGHFRTKFIGFLEKIINPYVDKVICVSDAVKQKVISSEEIDSQKVCIVYNGIDADKFVGLKPETNQQKKIFKVGMVAAMNREMKGHRYFIKAAEKVIEKRQDVCFVLVGDGPLKQGLESYAAEKNITEYFNFAGMRDDVREIMKEFDIFVMPSLSEGFSNAILEAMAMGVAVIATGIEGNLEIIDKDCGYFVRPADSEAIAEKILLMLENPDEIVAKGLNARKRVLNNFTIDIMGQKYERLISELSKRKGLINERV